MSTASASQKNSSFVPAESAEVGITDKILVKMNAQGSVSKVRSYQTSDFLVLTAQSIPNSKHVHE